MRQEVDRQLPVDLPTVYRQSLRQQVGVAVQRYSNGFIRPGWRFLAAEAVHGDAAMDLLWISPSELLTADELKTGAQAELFTASIAEQATTQFVACRDAYGESFDSVRVVLLAANRSFEIRDASGTVQWIS